MTLILLSLQIHLTKIELEDEMIVLNYCTVIIFLRSKALIRLELLKYPITPIFFFFYNYLNF